MEILMANIVPVGFTVSMGLVTLLIVLLFQYLNKKLKNEKIIEALNRVKEVVKTVVADLNQTVVASMREQTADGKLTREEICEIKNIALRTVRQYIPSTAQQLAEIGVGSFNLYLTSLIEQAVLESKTPGAKA